MTEPDINLDAESPSATVPEQAPSGEEESPKVGLIAKGIDTINGAIHEKLTEIPRSHGFGIALVVILSNVLFVSILTYYNYNNCETKLQMVDADWQPENADNFEPYKDQYKAPTFVCGSYKYNEEDMIYDTPCLLEGLDCSNYLDSRCPGLDFPCSWSDDEAATNEEEDETGDSTVRKLVLDPEVDHCSDQHPLASVVYVVCPSLSIAFGSSMGFVTYVQIVVLVLAYGLYACCNRKNLQTEQPLTKELQFLAQSSFEKNAK